MDDNIDVNLLEEWVENVSRFLKHNLQTLRAASISNDTIATCPIEFGGG